MAANHIMSWSFVENSVIDSEAAAYARREADTAGVKSLSPASCAFITTLVAGAGAQHVVEIGTGYGLGTLAIVAGRPGVELTTVDTNAEAQQVAREALRKAGASLSKSRIICGSSSDLLPRFAVDSYDVAILDGDPLDAADDIRDALRILRPGGTLVLAHVLLGGRLADAACRDEDVVAMREAVKLVTEDDSLLSSLIPLGDGFLIASARQKN